ncbi:LuxR C-terminal-related transcriptional regulator [Bradyrhizobium sp. SRS-191]|uniref:helix-turn-helix transcriptional regulator n=1 Tax=Bradyrhizobium sp. SRS-191 TaxID=2962606 RepID=UPI0027B8C241|nr:LuxR C-terminal-related transcriptional regulator [Bradyrhizobium sp. SRS-191]
MSPSIDDFISMTSSMISDRELLDAFLQTVDAEGYDRVMFAETRDDRLVSLQQGCRNGLPPSALGRDWHGADLVLRQIRQVNRPLRWNELCTLSSRGVAESRLLHEGHALGIRSGLVIPLHGPGTSVDLICLGRGERITEQDESIRRLYGIAVQYWLRRRDLHDATRPDSPRLTAREIECLEWCKEGKTNWEIGEIISTSEKTVEFHLSNAIRKLGACNRMTAVVAAIRAGAITV